MKRAEFTRIAAAVAFAVGTAGASMAAEAELEEVQVTGTRIARSSGLDTPTPVTSVEMADLQKMAPGNVIDALSQLPQFAGNVSSEQIIGGQNSGSANVNLRGAGVNRTLVLLDGRRVVSSNRFGTVDVNMFPEQLLRGIETVTGGASASYGTDAVAGVVNFLLDTEFEGFKVHGQVGMTTHGDGENYEAGAAFGHAFGDRFHLLASIETAQQDKINGLSALQDRPYWNQTSLLTNPDPAGPREIIRPYVSPTNFTNGGIFVDPPTTALPQLSQFNRVEFNPDGTYGPLPFTGVGSLNTGCQCFAEASQTFGVDIDEEILPEYDRSVLYARLGFDATDNLELYLQGIGGHTRNSDRRESVALLSVWQGRIYSDNAFLPPALATQMNTVLPANRRYLGFASFLPNVPESPLGEARQVADNEMLSGTAGFTQRFGDGALAGWRLDGYYQYGQNTQDFIAQNGIRTDRLPMALDAVRDANGRIVCRVSLPQFDAAGNFSDCVPINLFGGTANITPEMAAWIVDDGKVARQETDQHVAELVMSGELFEGWYAGPIGSAFGLSYRKDSLEQRTLDPSDEFPALPDGTLLADLGIHPAGLRGVVAERTTAYPGFPGYFGIQGLRHVPGGFEGDANSSTVLFSSLREISGDYNVKEAFAEFSVPLLRDVFLAQNLELNAAARWADYSGSGEIWAWKIGTSWQVNDTLRFRATASQDVRAATLQERFDQTRGGVNVQDPANGGITVTTASLSGGNPNVSPETARTLTAGLVYQPAFLEGFAASVDWYSIDIDDAIGQLTAQNIVTGCYNGDTTLCPYVIRRDNLPNGVIDRVENIFINLANQKISGVDLETTYARSLELFGGGPEAFTWRLFATFLDENSIQNRGAVRDERAGQVGAPFSLPEYRVTTSVNYRNGPVGVFLQGRWIDGGTLDRLKVESTTNVPSSVEDNTVPSVFYLDANISLFFGEDDNLDVYLNATNLLDRQPPYAPGIVGRTGTTSFNPAMHDVVGRRVALGVNYRF